MIFFNRKLFNTLVCFLVGISFILAQDSSQTSPTIWTGPHVIFHKKNYSDYNIRDFQDSITSVLILTRKNSSGIFNIAQENSYNEGGEKGPKDTEWALKTSNDVNALQFTSWYNSWRANNQKITDQVGKTFVVHIKSENIYFDFKLISWTDGGKGGGFKYSRSTPNNIIDSDGDGVSDTLDQCPDTPFGNELANVKGCISSQLDIDNDGITDDIDICPETPSGENVDENGCSTSQIKPVFWTGPSVRFIKYDYSNWKEITSQDKITDQVIITRANEMGIFNYVTDTIYNSTDNGPEGTEWAEGKISDGDILEKNFMSWKDIMKQRHNNVISNVERDRNMVLHLIEENIYIDIKFEKWTSKGKGGGFSYIRSTPLNIEDQDGDGVADSEDNCENTPEGQIALINGCLLIESDFDQDGIFDHIDECPNSIDPQNVDEKGCSPSNMWTGKEVLFEKVNYADYNLRENQDSILPNLILTRANNMGLFNSAYSQSYKRNQKGPAGTLWALGSIKSQSISSLDFKDWKDVVRSTGQTWEIPGKTFVVHSIRDNIYFDITFLSWQKSGQGGGFSYIRTTPVFLDDTDGDGVPDTIDQCNNTDPNDIAYVNGCSEVQKDDDGDGVSNPFDLCPETPEGEQVTDNGCSSSQIAPTFWTGPPVKFIKYDYVDYNLDFNSDNLTTSVTLARDYKGWLFNSIFDNSSQGDNPSNTEWAFGTMENNPTALDYKDLGDIFVDNGNKFPVMEDLVLHLKSENIFLQIKFLTWNDNDVFGGGYSYVRSTPSDIDDEDQDGVPDEIDQCNNSNTEKISLITGCSLDQTDFDQDGINDNLDKCPNSLPDVVIDSDGCAISQIWSGKKVQFKKPSKADYNDPMFQDSITSNVILTRQNNQGLFNIAMEGSYNRTQKGPALTMWAIGTTENLGKLDFKSWRDVVRSKGYTTSIVDHDLVLHLVRENIYLDFKFTQWQSRGNGGLTYQRSTPVTLETDDDQDGVDDSVDQCICINPLPSDTNSSTSTDNSSPGCPDEQSISDIFGCSILTFGDIDEDGITDDKDLCPDTPEGETVDENGCSDSQEKPTLWTGPKKYFLKENNSDYNQTENQDYLTDNVILTRQNNRGLFNIAKESSYGSTIGTKWAAGKISDGISQLSFNSWNQTMRSFGSKTYDAIGHDMVLYLEEDNIYIDVKFLSWTTGRNDHDGTGGGFSYLRSTVSSTLDLDEDGIADQWDECLDTPLNEEVNYFGCSSKQIDSDDDGVSDFFDKCPYTPEGENVNDQGCSENQLPITIWNGKKVRFEKEPDSDGNLISNQDSITESLTLARLDNRGLFNSILENEYDRNNRQSPQNTEWAEGTLEDIYNFGTIDPKKLVFKNWRDAVRTSGSTYQVPGKTYVVHVLDQNIYFELTFEKWSRGNSGIGVGGFSYTRSTPNIQNDSDGDGVSDDIDQCPDTPLGQMAYTSGCSEKQKDSDFDGVPDFEDLCPTTRIGSEVDEFGCSENEDKAQIWKGPKVFFQKFDNQPENSRENLDSISRFLWFSRGDQHLYNKARQVKYNETYGGPYDTEWAVGKTSMLYDPETGKEDLTRLSFAKMKDVFNSLGNSSNIVDKDYVVHVLSTNIYFDLRLLDYSDNGDGGGFSYERSTPNYQADEDGDGVHDEIDECSGTPSGTTVYINGCLLSDLDRDNDGVMDDIDQCPDTPHGQTVTEYGCLPPVLWTGPMVSFLKNDNDDFNSAEFQDKILAEVILTRGNNQGLFNVALEANYDRSYHKSPSGTLWAVGKISDGIENLDFTSWRDAVRSVGSTFQLVNHNFVMSIPQHNIFIDFKFTNWSRSNSGGGFGYMRSTPQNIEDLDGDGVANDIDVCPDTQNGVIANTKGCSIYQADKDNDGVIDTLDYCPDTRPGLEVDDFGCSAEQNSPIIWRGKKVYFEKSDGVNWKEPHNQDSIYSGLTLTRADNKGLFNTQQENQYNSSLGGPMDTEWAEGTINDELTSLNFLPWKKSMENEGYRASQLPGKRFVVHQISTNLYFEIEFAKWTNGRNSNSTGGFAYFRTTPVDIEDDDSDGIANIYDQCPNTPAYATATIFGCEIIDLDSDGDGVINEDDLCPQTLPGETVDENGCSPPILWTGPKVIFVKKDNSDWTKAENQDKLTDNYIFTRQNNRGLFNIAQENSYNSNSSVEGPIHTKWAFGDIEFLDQLSFMTWRDLMRSTGNGKMQDGVDKNMVVHLVQQNIYLELKFLSWRSGQEGDLDGGFSYIRSTPNGIEDSDGDGVSDANDLCPESPAGEITYVNGCTVDQNDEDFDGVLDILDQCLSTPFGAGVDMTGCITTTLWTGPNVLFVKDDYADWKKRINQDSIVGNVFFTRQDQRGLFNIAQEGGYQNNNPKDTEWAIGEITDGIENLEFKNWVDIFRNDNRQNEFVGKSLVVHLISTDIYFNIKFLSWTQGRNEGNGGGGFSYIRSTPLDQTDSDFDGVADIVDECPNTPYGHMVYPNGCSPFVTDRDLDGVYDYLDECPSTPIGLDVDEKGCPEVILWTGPKVIFEKKDNTNFALPENRDKIIDEIILTRGDKRGLYNAFSEIQYDRDSSPDDTRWAVGKIEDGVGNLKFKTWIQTMKSWGSTYNGVGHDMVLKIVSKNIYIDIKFLSWSRGNAIQGVSGGFSYERSTPYYENDQDLDGVPDDLDQCSDTPDSQTSYLDGCSIYQKDEDQDGISDFKDLCENTPLGDEVDENGCSSNQQVAQIWKGPKVIFRKLNYSNWRVKHHQDSLTENFIITRQFKYDIYNLAQENQFNSSARTPKNTMWAEGTTDDNLSELEFKPFKDVFVIDKDLVLFLVSDNIYLDIKFIDYAQDDRGGGLTYIRSTPNNMNDSDHDGVDDEVDPCDNQNLVVPVTIGGCLLSEMDSDQDGITDDLDLCPDTIAGATVDEKGCNYIIWTGPEILFKKTPYADPTLVANTDHILDGITFARGDNRGLFNSSAENSYNSSYEGPSGTRWALGKTSDGIENLEFMSWRDAARTNGSTYQVVGKEMVVYLIDHNTYFDLKFLSWDSGRNKPGGGFSYVRRSNESIEDSDGDGVPDLLDECSNTPSGTTVLQNGCPVDSLDSDGDGVPDNLDLCPDTPEIEQVDENGCSSSQKSPILWTGKKVYFEKKDHADYNDSKHQDSLTSNVILTRKGNRGLFNIAKESSYGSTLDTEWAVGSIEESNLNDLVFMSWKDAFRSLGRTHENVGRTFVMHMISDNIYVDVKLLHWTKSNNGGGFAYERGTPLGLDDQDQDGVPDVSDQCPDTPPSETANVFGCSVSQTDKDGDGVYDLNDLCPDTPDGALVDEKGCAEGQTPIVLWTGKKVKFIKRDDSDWLNKINQDSLTSNVILTRQDNRGLFNIAKETSYGSTQGTKWAVGTLNQIKTRSGLDPSKLNFKSWRDAMRTWGSTHQGVDKDLVMHLQDDNIYLDIKFTSWSRGRVGGKGGFTYIRSTPDEIVDSDLDGVDDTIDQCLCEIDPEYMKSIVNEGDESEIDKTPTSATSSEVTVNGLVIHLNSLIEDSYNGSGSYWNDISGNGNHLSIVGSPTFNNTNGFTFEGNQTEKYFFINNFSHPTEKFSDEYYLKTSVNNLGAFKAYNVAGNDNQSVLMDTDNIQIFSRASLGKNNNISSGVAIDDGEWHHFVRTSDRANGEEKLYIDGKLVFTGKINPGVSILQGGTLILGNEMDDTFNPPNQMGRLSASNAFDGFIPIYRLYNKVLSHQEILNNYNSIVEFPFVLNSNLISETVSNSSIVSNTLEINFSESIYGGTSTVSDIISIDDFTMSISGGTASFFGNSPTDMIVEGKKIKFYFDTNIEISGDEKIILTPNSASVFDAQGNAFESSIIISYNVLSILANTSTDTNSNQDETDTNSPTTSTEYCDPNEIYLVTGCSEKELDTDFDGIPDLDDYCPETPIGEEVDERGCSSSQKSPTLWLGKKVIFKKYDGADWTLSINQDSLTSNVIITRKNKRGLFNIAQESSYGSTIDTEWAYGSLEDGNPLLQTYRPWRDHMKANGNITQALNKPMILHLISDHIYIDLTFNEWTDEAQGGGFSYTRSTPENIDDTDSDGVPDSIDQCEETSSDITALTTGCDPSQADQDQDGVLDILDQCLMTPIGYSVDEKGCPLIQLWTGPNVIFKKDKNTSWQTDKDSLTVVSEFTRSNSGSNLLFNAKYEDSYTSRVGGPLYSNWALGTLDNLSSLDFKTLNDLRGNLGGVQNMIGENMVVHLLNENIYFELKFTDWSESSMSFTYERSTPININDIDSDGVDDLIDNCTDTPEDEISYIDGCSENQKDQDQDGVIDLYDLCPDTPENEIVDQNGCSDSQVKAVFWNGPSIIFEKQANTDWTITQNQDSLTPNVILTRQDRRGLFNIAQESSFGSTVDTEWAVGYLTSSTLINELDFMSWREIMRLEGRRTYESININFIVHLKSENIFLNLKFIEWGQRNGYLKYQRSTPSGEIDDDFDGVPNSIDQCPDTPEEEIADNFGCSISQFDDDKDGVVNGIDLCPDTPEGELVDQNGCSDSQTPPIIWKGKKVRFKKIIYADWTRKENHDSLTPEVELARSTSGLFNLAKEESFNQTSGQTNDVEWALGNLDENNPVILDYDNWSNIFGSDNQIREDYSKRYIGHLISENIYFEMRIEEWSRGSMGGGYKYIRSTPLGIEDSDLDGIADSVDLCPETPSDVTAYTSGCSDDQEVDIKIKEVKDLGLDLVIVTASNTIVNIDYQDDSNYTAQENQESSINETFTETLDSDGDGIPDNQDIDDDNDGFTDQQERICGTDPLNSNNYPEDIDSDQVPDCKDDDLDNDGYPNAIDAFPLDPSEWFDNDSDHIGDNLDQDDDNDEYLDEAEIACGSDPNSNLSIPKDFDKDRVPDCIDSDDDNDGCIDQEDVFPLNENECFDSDGDGIGDNSDIDADNDGVFNDYDAFPTDPNESKDSDGDGIGDNADLDDNNDGYPENPITNKNGEVVIPIFVSELLTPNEQGEESKWKIINIEKYPSANVKVYSPSGLIVYESWNYKNDWGGTNMNGETLPTGPYFYVIDRGDESTVEQGWLYIFN